MATVMEPEDSIDATLLEHADAGRRGEKVTVIDRAGLAEATAVFWRGLP
jgi:hypothetical protein